MIFLGNVETSVVKETLNRLSSIYGKEKVLRAVHLWLVNKKMEKVFNGTKCKFCGKETGDRIEICRECAEEIFFKWEKRCYICGQPATKEMDGHKLCEECYQLEECYKLHVNNNARTKEVETRG